MHKICSHKHHSTIACGLSNLVTLPGSVNIKSNHDDDDKKAEVPPTIPPRLFK